MLVSIVALAAIASPAHASKSQFTIFDASEELTGSLCCSVLTNPALDDARGLGADTVRVLVYWSDVVAAPDATAKPAGDSGDPAWPGYAQPGLANQGGGWGKYDQLVRQITARGMSVVMVPTGRFPDGRVPRWAGNSPATNGTDPDPAEYGLFLKALGERYRGGYDPDGPGGLTAIPAVSFVGVWNEPNSPYQLQPQVKNGAPYTPTLYRRLFSAGSSGLRQGGFRGQIWMGELAPRGTGTTLGALAFTRRFLCLSPAKGKPRRRKKGKAKTGALKAGCPILRADAFAHHPHSGIDAPFRPPFGHDDVTIGNVPSLGRLLRKAAKAGAINPMPIVLSEYGIQTNPPDALSGLSFQQQAEYIGIAEYLAYRNPKVSAWSQYLLRDDSSLGGFQSGLRLRDGAFKPAFGAFRTPLVIRKPQGRNPRRVSGWGEVRPTGGAHVQIQRSDGRLWRPATPVFQTDGRGYFQRRLSYKRGRQFRLVWFDATDGFGSCSGDCVGPPIRAYGFK
ncbi:MAG: hypothetical protein ABR536_04975 [Solirubrobacterales bacterium]